MSEQRGKTWIWAALAFGLGVAWQSAGPRLAHANPPQGERGTFVVTAPGVNQGNNVIYLVDESSQRLLVYEHAVGQRGTLNLVHARAWEHDAKLVQFPTAASGKQTPSVKEVKKAVAGG